MESDAAHHLEQILNRVRQVCSNVVVREYDISEQRALLQLTAEFNGYRIAVTEIVRATSRGYAYYLLRGTLVVIGWDNAPDRLALRLKYGKDFTQHLYQEIPHEHRGESVALTHEKTMDEFLALVQSYRG